MSSGEGNGGGGSGSQYGNRPGVYPDLGSAEIPKTEVLLAGVAPAKKLNEGSEMNSVAEVANGCKCSPCKCDPCNC